MIEWCIYSLNLSELMGIASSSPLWCYPPDPLVLARDEVHVWRASLDFVEPNLKHLHRLLSVDERQRAERFAVPQDRDAFIAARGLLRLILSRYLAQEPEALCFHYGLHGKPSLALESNPNRFCFNLSHSAGLALYAVVMDQEVGVDLERVHSNLPYEAIARRFFSPQESATLLALPVHERCQAFFNCWTRKEAYVKAQGRGIALPLNQFEVSFSPGEVAALLSIGGDSRAAASWTLQALHPGPDYRAALAIAGQDWQIRCWQWQE